MEQYSLEVKKIFKEAENIMKSLNHSYVGTEHLFLSMLKYSEEVKEIFLKYDITYEKFLDELILVIGVSNKKSGVNMYTPLLKRVIGVALDNNPNKEIRTLDLLDALLEEGEGIAIRILVSMDVDIDKLYEKNNNKKNKLLEVLQVGTFLEDIVNDDILIGRENELNLIIETLIRKNKNNPLLIGRAGVGKSAIIEELARRIKNGNVPKYLKNKKIISLEMSNLVAGTKYRGEFEEKLGKIIKEIEDNPDFILFIDEIHTMTNAGGAEGAINASDILKPYLARGKVKIIGATTINEYNKYFVKDKALTRRFEVIKINEPNEEETEEILMKIKHIYEKHYNINISNDNIKKIIKLTNKYIIDRCNPDKSIDMLDSICAMKLVEEKKDEKIIENEERLEKIKRLKEDMVKRNNFKKAIEYKNEEINYNNNINILKNKVDRISNSDILKVVLRKSNIPNIEINWSSVYKKLKDEIIGQEKGIKEIIEVLKDENNSNPSILLTGSTGVGKTKTVKEIAKLLKLPMIRLDMSEYNKDMSITRLIGSSAGYIGYDDEFIFDKIKMQPKTIILLDEVEKASNQVLNLFLQILDEGYVTNAKGEKINFANTIIFMTSNAISSRSIGFMKNKENYYDYFSKEFLGRITKIINYKNVDEEMIKKYLDKKNISNYEIIKDFNYKEVGFRGLDKYINSKKGIANR